MVGRGWSWVVVAFALLALLGCGRQNGDGEPSGEEKAPAVAPGPAAEPVVLAEATDQQVLADVAVDRSGVYFGGGRTEQAADPRESDVQVGVVRQVGKDGGGVRELWRGAGIVHEVVTTEGSVYFLAHDYPDRAGRLRRVGKAGGEATTMGDWLAHGTCTGLATDGDYVYWSYSAGGLGGPINRTMLAGGLTVTLAEGETCPGAMAVAEDVVVWAGGDKLLAVAHAGGGQTEVLASFRTEIETLAAAPDGDAIDVVAERRLMRVGVDGDGPARLAEVATRVSDLAADEDHVYLALPGWGQIVRVPAAGGAAEVVTARAGGPNAVAVDDGFVYWVDGDGRRVMRVAKGE